MDKSAFDQGRIFELDVVGVEPLLQIFHVFHYTILIQQLGAVFKQAVFDPGSV